MGAVRRIAKNTVVMIAGQIFGKILSLIFVIYVARYLQAEGFGILSFALAFAGMFHIFADIGFYELTVREVARDKKLAGKYVGNIMVLKVILVTFVFGLICLTINAMNYPILTITVVYIIGLSIVFDAFSVISNAIFQAFESLELITIGTVLRGVLLVIGGIIAIRNGWDILAFASLYLMASLAVFMYSLPLMLVKFAKPKFEIDLDFWKFVLKEGVPFWASAVLTTIFYNIDKVMLSAMIGNEAVGYYSASYRIISTLHIISISFIASIFPVTSRLYVSSKDKLKFTFERSFKYMAILGVTIGVTVTLLSEKIIILIYGEGYRPSISALQILVWAEAILFFNATIRNLFKSINRQIIILYTLIPGVSSNVVLNWLLIPKFSFIGASFATVVARFIMLVLSFIWLMRTEYKLSSGTMINTLRILLIALVVWFAINIINIGDGSILSVLFIGGFFILLYLLKIIDDVDKRLIKDILSSVRLK